MTGNRMAYPLLISLANIDASIQSKLSLHGYLLLALLPIAKFLHKTTHVHSLLQDRLVHKCLDKVLAPLKIAAAMGIMMNDPVGNLRYCFTPLASWIVDTPEESLLSVMNCKASPVTVATLKQFGDAFRHPSRTGPMTLAAIRMASAQSDPSDYKEFLKTIKPLHLNGVVEPVWRDWPLSDPSDFLTPEPLHHFHRMFWDHDTKWCIAMVGAAELDFRFSLVQTPVGYRAFDEGISKLKQVTGCDHRAVQRYIIGLIAGAVPLRFLIAVRALVEFRYLAQAPTFTEDSLTKVANALQIFHDHKDAIVRANVRSNWEIPKMELLQSVVRSIRLSGAVMQWSADPTEHAHVQEIKVPARAGNNQNYYNQIVHYLDRSEKCFRFDIATFLESHATTDQVEEDNNVFDEEEDPEQGADSAYASLPGYMATTRAVVNYFRIAEALIRGLIPNAVQPYRTFSTATTAFHLGAKPSLRLSIDEAATLFNIPDLQVAIWEFLRRVENHEPHPVSGNRSPGCNFPLPFNCLQIWHKIHIQQMCYHHCNTPDSPQTV
jgi:hypothetical protein